MAGGGETNTANDTANDPTTINAAGVPDLTITKTHVGNFTQGQTGATYTITVTNSGTAATSGTVTGYRYGSGGIDGNRDQRYRLDLHTAERPVHSQRRARGGCQLSGDHADSQCGGERACERHQYGDGIGRRRNQYH